MTLTNLAVVWLGIVLFGETVGLGQSSVKPPQSPLTLDQAVDFALANYPAVRASMERALASKEGVSLSRTTYLPRTDLLWQSNRATRNNIFGLYLPQAVVPPISGPVLSSTSDRGVWGSMAGILLSWEPFDFGYRGVLRIEKVSRLRVVVPIPENYFSGTVNGAKVNFTVPASPGERFTGTIARIPDSLDVKTRTMPVELDVENSSGRLAPGMYAEVDWPVQRSRATLFVPTSAIARTNERRFLVAVRNGKSEWVDVKTGATVDKMTEVFGDLHEGDVVAVRGTDELRPGTSVSVQQNAEK
jgi:multidrug efflux pump subunit AcrA (membrane-fusion protein)